MAKTMGIAKGLLVQDSSNGSMEASKEWQLPVIVQVLASESLWRQPKQRNKMHLSYTAI